MYQVGSRNIILNMTFMIIFESFVKCIMKFFICFTCLRITFLWNPLILLFTTLIAKLFEFNIFDFKIIIVVSAIFFSIIANGYLSFGKLANNIIFVVIYLNE